MHVYTDFHGYLGYTYLEHTTTRRTGLTFPLRSPPSHFSRTYFFNLDTCSYFSIKKLNSHLARETILDRRSCSSAHPNKWSHGVLRSFTKFSVIKHHWGPRENSSGTQTNVGSEKSWAWQELLQAWFLGSDTECGRSGWDLRGDGKLARPRQRTWRDLNHPTAFFLMRRYPRR